MNVGVNSPDYSTVRKPSNWASHGPIEDVTSAQMACNQVASAPKIFSVAAGAQLPIYYSQAPYHPGPYQVYLAKVPEGETAATWTPKGDVWFKIYSSGATFKGPGEMFPATCK